MNFLSQGLILLHEGTVGCKYRFGWLFIISDMVEEEGTDAARTPGVRAINTTGSERLVANSGRQISQDSGD